MKSKWNTIALLGTMMLGHVDGLHTELQLEDKESEC